MCGEEVSASLQAGSFLVASRSNSERTVSTNFPALVAALFKLKRAHWKYGVYFVFSFGFPDIDDVEGDSKVFAFNLTRLMDGSSERPIPDEVLNQQQMVREAQEEEEEEEKENDGRLCEAPSFPRVVIKHHNGGPVKWSSHRSGMFVVNKETLYVEEQLRRRDFVSDVDAAARSGDPAAVFLSSFHLIPLSETSCLVLGRFSLIMEIVQSLRHMFADGSEIVVFSFSGYAEWTKAQLLREVARGSWGVVHPQTALVACDELLNPSHTVHPTAHPPSLEELSAVAKVASNSVRQSCNASETLCEQQENSNTTQESMEPQVEDSKVLLASHQKSDDGDEDDSLPPIPQPVRIATRGSVTRARSASNTAALACSGTHSDSRDNADDVESATGLSSLSVWRDVFCDIDESNIWDKMINISIESGDNLIRQSYS